VSPNQAAIRAILVEFADLCGGSAHPCLAARRPGTPRDSIDVAARISRRGPKETHMNRSKIFAALFLSGSLAACAIALTRGEPEPVRVGVFDSRAVAVAYAHSPQNRATLEALIKERDSATDAKVKAACEKKGEAMQARLHQQGFSTASVADILAVIEQDLPAIASEAGVDVMVSKWDLAYRRDGVEFVDVTSRIIAPFQPDDRVKKMIAGLEGVEPLSLYGTDWDALDRH
jgi:hypothetical protein